MNYFFAYFCDFPVFIHFIHHNKAVERFRSASYADGGGSPDDVGEFSKKNVGNKTAKVKGFLVEELHPSHSEFFLLLFYFKITKKNTG